MEVRLPKYIKVAAISVAIFYCVIQAYSGGDFKIYLGAAELLSEGKNCYNVWIHLGGDNYCGYSYSPIFALILIPFTYLPYPITQIIWLIANLFFLYRIFKLLNWHLPLSSFNQKQYKLWIILSTALVVRFILHNFEMVQMTIFLVFCCLEANYQSNKNKTILCALIISLGIIIKIIPIIMIPYFIYRKQFKPVLISLVYLVAFLLFPALIYGWDFNTILMNDWLNIINFNNPEFSIQQNKNGEGVHSLSGFLAAYFTDVSRTDITINRTITLLNDHVFTIVLNATRLFFILLTLYFLKIPAFIKQKSKLIQLWELSYIFCITPLIFPHQQKYAFFFITPACCYIVFFLIKSYKKNMISKNTFNLVLLILILQFILSTLTTDGIIGRDLHNLSQYFKTITIGTFLLIVSLMICNPKQLILDEQLDK